ncbi:hypothetical protein A1D23_13340 [Chelonobacter oris]|uniref:hypothetical protein n=1 Tax=Chelonobacter oris TaxID=505317 RepID=UPI002446FFF6|nr:hypothetical protein [Chelonobacter oris]MDH3001569.1 hypothetical protein [Chelonobacter oris]
MKKTNKINFLLKRVCGLFYLIAFFLFLDFITFLYANYNGYIFNFDFMKVIETSISLFIPLFLLDLIYYLGNAKRKGKFDKK